MRYGTVPIVRATGGLKDTVQHLKSGIVFKDYSADALSRALKQSLKLYATPRTLTRVVTAGMKKDFSWKPSAQKYLSLYRDIV
jgi:starch synthase